MPEHTRADDPDHVLDKERARVKKDDSPFGDEEEAAVLHFINAYDADKLTPRVTDDRGNTETKAKSTLEAYSRGLRLLAADLDDSLLDVTANEINAVMDDWLDSYADQTVKVRQVGVSAFLEHVQEHTDADPTADPDEVVIVQVDQDPAIDLDEVFTGDEIDAMRDACRNARDRCLIDLLAYTGQRIRAIQTLRIRDVDPDKGASGRYRLNTDDGGLKGADQSGPLLGAQKSVREWLRQHPTGNDDDYLLTSLPSSNAPDDGSYLARPTIRIRLDRIGADAGVWDPETEEGKRPNPHAFRHFFVTTAYRDYDLSPSRIKSLIGHSPDSMIMETTYAHLTDEDQSKAAEEAWGYDVERDNSPLTPPACPTCDEPLPGSARACPGCGMVFTPDAKAVEEQMENDLRDHYGEAAREGDEDVLDGLDSAAELLENPRIRAALVQLADKVDE